MPARSQRLRLVIVLSALASTSVSCSLLTSFEGFSGAGSAEAGTKGDATTNGDGGEGGAAGEESAAPDVSPTPDSGETGSSASDSGVPESGGSDASNDGAAAEASPRGDAAPGNDATADASGCPTGSALCGGVCVNTSTDNANCGACGIACAGSSGQFCVSGQCGSECSGSFSTTHAICTNNGSLCTDLTSTPGDCSSCTNNCTSSKPGSVCTSSACACAAGSSPSAAGNCLIGGLVALSRTNWTVSASLNNGSVAMAVDGDLTTRWASGAAQASGQWLEINFGSTVRFSQIVLDATNNGGDYPGTYAVYVSRDGTNWGSAVTTGTGSAITTIAFAEQTAQYAQVQLTSSANSNWWSIDEVNVYSANPPTGTPIPQARNGWTATASVSGAGNPASNALDGSSTTYWNSFANQTTGMWFQVAMNGPVTFDEITMPTYMGSGGADTNYPGTYAVYVSNDGATWGSAIATGTGSPTTTVTFSPVTARYIQVSLTAGNGYWWTLSEFNVYQAAN